MSGLPIVSTKDGKGADVIDTGYGVGVDRKGLDVLTRAVKSDLQSGRLFDVVGELLG